MINTAYTMECDDCMEPLTDQWEETLEHTSWGGILRAAQKQGWFVQPEGMTDGVQYCPSCRVENNL